MSQILDPLPNDRDDNILCCYVNATSRIQIARITNVANWYFERVVFPGQRLVFEADPTAILEIHCGMMASAILSDTIPCTKLSLENGNRQQNTEKQQTVKNNEESNKVATADSVQEAKASPSINLAV